MVHDCGWVIDPGSSIQASGGVEFNGVGRQDLRLRRSRSKGWTRLGPAAATTRDTVRMMAHSFKRQSGILFVDRRNDALSQIAEGFARELLPANFRIKSAGVTPARPSPTAIQVMAEVGVDITDQFSKSLLSIDSEGIDYLVVLERGVDIPLIYRKAARVDWNLDSLEHVERQSTESLGRFRCVRETLRSRIVSFEKAMRLSQLARS